MYIYCVAQNEEKTAKTLKYTGLEHRQTLRAYDFNCDLQIEIENENIDK